MNSLTESGVNHLLRDAEQGGRRLLAISKDRRIAGLARAAELWLREPSRRAGAAKEIHASTGYAAPMVEDFLAATFRAFADRELTHALLAPEGLSAQLRSAAVAGTGLAVAILAQNTPALAMAPVFAALAAGSAVIVKSSRGETSFARRLAESITEVDEELGSACLPVIWDGGNRSIEHPILDRASRVIAYGGRATTQALRTRLGERLIAFGPRVSVAVVGIGADQRAADAAGSDGATAQILARQIATLDQRGCLSPQAVLVDARIDLAAFADLLGQNLARLERDWPRRVLSMDERATFRRFADQAETDVLSYRSRSIVGGIEEPWAIVVEQSAMLRPSPLDRFVRLHPYTSIDELGRALAPLQGQLECVGIAAAASVYGHLSAAAEAAGARRVCRLDEMQSPPILWHLRAGDVSPE